MAKQFRCKDLGIGCDIVIEATSEEELVAKALQHILSVHGLDMSEQPMLDYLKAAITSRGKASPTFR
jgi:predicted small metal-binding protein